MSVTRELAPTGWIDFATQLNGRVKRSRSL